MATIVLNTHKYYVYFHNTKENKDILGSKFYCIWSVNMETIIIYKSSNGLE